MFRVYGRDAAAEDIAKRQPQPQPRPHSPQPYSPQPHPQPHSQPHLQPQPQAQPQPQPQAQLQSQPPRLPETPGPKAGSAEAEPSPSPFADSMQSPESPMATDISPAPHRAVQDPPLPNVPDEPGEAQPEAKAPSLGQVRRQQEAASAAAQRGVPGSPANAPPPRGPSGGDQGGSKACSIL
mmetsp:Transcript_87177/g.270792  ORF Transcript_87177/g.270792 Transcript_87177/m.270792 type:complete len:181 (-) Transcript_87177:46-588(-)